MRRVVRMQKKCSYIINRVSFASRPNETTWVNLLYIFIHGYWFLFYYTMKSMYDRL